MPGRCGAGVVVRAGGELSLVAPEANAAIVEAPVHRWATAFALVLAALAFPLWATAPSAVLRRSAVGVAVAAASVAVFHLVAADQVSALVLVIPPSALLLDAASLHRRASWR
jgi:hypothetical protein